MPKDKTTQATKIIQEIDRRYSGLVNQLFNARTINERVFIHLHGTVLEKRKRNLINKYILNK